MDEENKKALAIDPTEQGSGMDENIVDTPQDAVATPSPDPKNATSPAETDVIRAFMAGASFQKLQDKIDSLERKVSVLKRGRGRKQSEARSSSGDSDSHSSTSSAHADEQEDSSPSPSPPPRIGANAKAKLVYARWDAFHDPILQSEPGLAPITVLVGEPELNEGSPSSTRQTVMMAAEAGFDPSRDPLPERIRIFSAEIFDALREIGGLRGTMLSHKLVKRGLILLRPYRWLSYYEQPLRDWTAKVEEKHESQAPVGYDNSEAVKEADDIFDEPRQDSVKALVHLRCLIDFIDIYIRPKKEYITSSKCLEVYFHELSFLFQPGDEILGPEEKQAFRVHRVKNPVHSGLTARQKWPAERGPTKRYTYFRLSCSYITSDGQKLGGQRRKVAIFSFNGKKPIKSFPVYPLRLANDKDIRTRLMQRGKLFLDVLNVKPMYYKGYTLPDREEVDGPVMIDFKEAILRNQEWEKDLHQDLQFAQQGQRVDCLADSCGDVCCKRERVYDDAFVEAVSGEDFRHSQILQTGSGQQPSLLLMSRVLKELHINGGDYTPSDGECVIMDYEALGFVLRSRKWARLDLDHLSYEDQEQNKADRNAFDRLVLPDGHKDMLQALVTQHFRGKKASSEKSDLIKGNSEPQEGSDLIKGKGKGIIVLLHGAPGVGKTTTAEGIAEMFQRPLYQITCGDLGTTADEVEKRLQENFALASKWGCILLLDEADVFLAQRERKDFVRNGLVAVFLRILEYYTGVLFLTTNRVGDFDEAFSSRIHMSLFYPELDEEKTKRVFQLNLDLMESRCTSQGRKLTCDKSSILRFAQDHYEKHSFGRWNGRQIRNACQTALALAEFEAQDKQISLEVEPPNSVFLQLKHLETVQKAYLQFSQYLGDVFGTKGDRRAEEHQFRAAGADSPGPIAQRVADQQSGRIWYRDRCEDEPRHVRYEGGFVSGGPASSYHYVSQSPFSSAPRAGYGPVAGGTEGSGPATDQTGVDVQIRDHSQPGRAGWSDAEAAAPRVPQADFLYTQQGHQGVYEQRGRHHQGWVRRGPDSGWAA
ncbi:hypothetical protein XA68_12748 [Ophiocordyceps unilateralis]|uniref:AAA+ ATPase domain-containing protein n=1 Tax=Ophiocordyceps unilateralis TaxID=268505 RepID=A0A2A9PD77_OPHUN|nr:hypothetical protein XA68_12748 [Ophiocordyceps unilateralis]